MPINKKQQGFTLIELMIVVAIVGILAAFAYPSYVAQVQKSKRSDAQVGLQQIAERQEAFYVRNYLYATSLSALGYAADTIDSPEREYDLSVQAGSTAQAYTLRAVPKATSGQRSDKSCAVFTLDQMGRKGARDSSGASSAICW